MFEKYEWIVVSKDCDNDIKKMRRKIRSHAMKATAASRKRSTKGNEQANGQRDYALVVASTTLTPPNSAQYRDAGERPSELGSPKFQMSEENVDLDSDRSFTNTPSLGSPMPLSGLDLLTAEIGLNVLDLSTLTTVHIGHRATSLLTRQPSCLGRLISRRRLSYFNYLPAKFGHTDCLDDAVRCVAVKAKRVLTGSGRLARGDRALEISLYGKALRSLQHAVYDLDGHVQSADVLCAIQVLGIYELIEQSSQHGWSQHVSGASRLVRMKGPLNFQSDFEKLLLHATVGPIVCESFRINQPCYLEEEPWHQLFRSLASTRPFARGGYVGINLLCIMTRMPRLMRDVSDAVGESETSSPARLDKLIMRIRQFRMDLRKWRATFDALVLYKTDLAQMESSSFDDEQCELLGALLTLSILGCRMLSAVSMDMVVLLEDEALTYAEQMVKMHSDVTLTNGWASFFLCQKVSIAQATLKTRNVWKESSRISGRIEKSRFKEWCDAMPRSLDIE